MNAAVQNERILAIDDEEMVLRSIEKLCSAAGWLVDRVPDAIQGLARVQERSYSLIFCDILMPEMDGFEFLDMLQRKQVQTPVIITSGFCTAEYIVKSMDKGAFDFLAKPFTYDEMISVATRGIRWNHIMQSVGQPNLGHPRQSDGILPYVPCPPKYMRLGYSTWFFSAHDGTVKVGLTDLFLRTAGVIHSLNLPEPGQEMVQGMPLGTVEEEEDLIHILPAPVSGRVLATNHDLINDLTLVEKDPYFKGWLCEILPTNLELESEFLTPCSSDPL